MAITTTRATRAGGDHDVGEAQGEPPTAAAAVGIWTTNTQAQSKLGGIWPGSPTPTVDYLVVAGGAGGGCNHAGGGAGGGMRTATSFSVTAGVSITVTV